MRVYLTGFMASGKTVVGRLLSHELGYDFCDLDDLVERATGKTAVELFAQDGERAFREAEQVALRSTAELDRFVIALGGGTLAAAAEMEWARQHGIVVYLEAEPEELARRLLSAPDDRPLVSDARGADDPLTAMITRVNQLLDARRATYEKADVVFVSGRGEPEDVARRLARLLRPGLPDPSHGG